MVSSRESFNLGTLEHFDHWNTQKIHGNSGAFNWTLQPASLHSTIHFKKALIARWLKLKDPVRLQACPGAQVGAKFELQSPCPRMGAQWSCKGQDWSGLYLILDWASS